ncbi:MAG: phosphate acyltransferase PlsX [Rhizobiales bacterium]|nr:phosphate acyltransferase PlsX [Hyphomicrobiales bacterium]
MSQGFAISLDAMGGDRGPSVIVAGAAISLERNPSLRFRLHGDEALIRNELARHSRLAEACEVVHTDVAVAMGAKPSQALREGRRNSSMWRALEDVRDGRARAAVSAGNTGALMAMSKFCLKPLAGVERPAIVAIWPTVNSECLVLDVGANVGATSRQLVDFAVMGAAMARGLFSLARPRVGLLNIGAEEVKGLEEVKAAHAYLRGADVAFEYVGFVEGDDIGHDVTDVVVTEGFSGNIALKTAEGTARQIAAYLRAALNHSMMSQMGAFLARDAFEVLKAKMDTRRMNGGVFLGLRGLVVKSHGGTDATGFASAVDLGYEMARGDLVARLEMDLDGLARAPAGGAVGIGGRGA